MLRVGLDVTPLLGEPTGIHQHTRALTDALGRRADVEISGWLLTGRGARPDLPFAVHRSRLPATLVQRLWGLSSLPRQGLLAGPVDVVHGTNFLAPPAAGSVVTIHDTTPMTHPHLTAPAVAAKARAIRRILRSPALVHTPSRLVADQLIADRGADPDRVITVAHGLRTAPAATPHPGVEGHGRYIVTVGTTEKRKRIPTVIAALEHLPDDIGLVIAGPIGNDESAVTRAIGRLPEPARVLRVTALSDASRDSLVTGASVLVHAAEYEGFGFTPLEALQVGTPVAATAVGALPELIGDEITLVDPGADDVAHALADRILLTLDTPIPSGVRQRLDALTWDATATAMVDVYARAAAERTSRARP